MNLSNAVSVVVYEAWAPTGISRRNLAELIHDEPDGALTSPSG
ncbi:Uncharacterised protein [Kluyvera cryocrescens]|uniref:Uncharacterized protein n=1 Tax=Kluyvera cryocrescens TaxID=580 RepID=A0A485AKE5_KLUCR|nr:Uncharacterised protein [Kluyvera cryocrescens]